MVDLSYKFQLLIVNRLNGDPKSNDVDPLEYPRHGLAPEMYLVVRHPTCLTDLVRTVLEPSFSDPRGGTGGFRKRCLGPMGGRRPARQCEQYGADDVQWNECDHHYLIVAPLVLHPTTEYRRNE